MPPGTTLGHVHLQVSDLDDAEPFWVDALGFEVIARMAPHAPFVSAGGYHHHVGLNTWAGMGAPQPPEGARGLVQFDVVLPNEGERRRGRRASGARRGGRATEKGASRARSVREHRAPAHVTDEAALTLVRELCWHSPRSGSVRATVRRRSSSAGSGRS